MISKRKKRFFARIFPGILLRLSIALCVIYIFYKWTNRFDTVGKRKQDTERLSGLFPDSQSQKNFTNEERRIAKHFEIDTLPGLMRQGLIKKYERYQTGTLLHVAGNIWKKRSRFFKESLLTEVLVYNNVNGYALETRIVDYNSQILYAQAISSDKKKFFD